MAALRTTIDGWTEARSERDFHRLHTEFHVGIGRASGSEQLRRAGEQSRLELNEALLAQLEAGDAKAAVRRMEKHLEHTEKGIDALIAALG